MGLADWQIRNFWGGKVAAPHLAGRVATMESTPDIVEGYDSLTEKERETLRLLLHGHDAKSMARELGLSVHTVNERLRNARRKLDVTNSKEAARLLFERESEAPHFLGHKSLGDAHATGNGTIGRRTARMPRAAIIGGLLVMSLLLAKVAITLWSAPSSDLPIPARMHGSASQESIPAQADLERAENAALAIFSIVDRPDFDIEGAQSGETPANDRNFAAWNSLVERRRERGVALGRKIERIDILGRESGNHWIVRFKTDFENLRGAYEKVTLAEHEANFVAVDYEVE